MIEKSASGWEARSVVTIIIWRENIGKPRRIMKTRTVRDSARMATNDSTISRVAAIEVFVVKKVIRP